MSDSQKQKVSRERGKGVLLLSVSDKEGSEVRGRKKESEGKRGTINDDDHLDDIRIDSNDSVLLSRFTMLSRWSATARDHC